ncbi:MAG: DNA modification system-associated small protein [Parvibaculum sp.]|jgi:hypothetical protein
MSDSTPGFALETLLEVAEASAADVPKDLLRRLVLLQAAHQYDDDRELVIQETRRALEEFISQSAEEGLT